MQIRRETVSGEALFILQSLKENGRLGRSNKLADVKATLEPTVSLEFDSYFFFLRKFHYIAMDREAQLHLTDDGEKVVDGKDNTLGKFTSEVGEFFAEQLDGDGPTAQNGQAEMNGNGAHAEPPPSEAAPEDAVPPLLGRRKAAVAPPVFEEPLAAPMTSARMDYSEVRRDPPAPIPIAPVASYHSGQKPIELDGRYAKLEPLGAGPLGSVFKGRHQPLNADICIKELKDIFGYFSFLQRSDVVKRLRKELCGQAAIRHPNIVSIIDQNSDGSRPYFIMELCVSSLKEKLEQSSGKGLPVTLAIRSFLQLAYALKAAHGQAVTHHNLKPENVLFDAYGNVKLGDFGLSRVVEVDASKGMPQVFVGTGGMPYWAPELIGKSKDAGPSADIYSLGILLYEMLTGQIPGRRSPMPSEINKDAPSNLDSIFDKMTQDKRDARYPDIDAMLGDFYAAFDNSEYLNKGDLILWSEAPKSPGSPS